VTAGAPYRLVVFDCDSTLTRIEGVDELARMCGLEAEIAALTAAAMEGRVALEEVYARRLERLRPDRPAVERLGNRYIEELVPGARETLRTLRNAGVETHIISGGFLPAVTLLAAELELRPDQVHAVALQFAADGRYVGFDHASPLSRSGGKRIVCAGLMGRFGRCAAVGDGITDLEMQDAGADFIGFGGVVERAAVRQCAARYVTAPDLRELLPLLAVESRK
jgi:phosphoserine phosphatase